MPGRSWRSRFSPGSRTIFTGTPLHDLDVVAGSIFGREHAENRAGRAGNAVHVAFISSAVRIHLDVRALSDPHGLELRFLKVGGDPDFVQGDNRQQLLAGLNVHADHHALVHFAAHRRHDLRVFQVQLSLLESGALLLHVGHGGERASAGRCHLLRPGLGGAVAGLGLGKPAPGLLDRLCGGL